jgi:hypothetical protein
MARGKHLFPFRTEQLSPSAPMVLGPQGPGRVGRRRFLLRAPVASGAGARLRSGAGCPGSGETRGGRRVPAALEASVRRVASGACRRRSGPLRGGRRLAPAAIRRRRGGWAPARRAPARPAEPARCTAAGAASTCPDAVMPPRISGAGGRARGDRRAVRCAGRGRGRGRPRPLRRAAAARRRPPRAGWP